MPTMILAAALLLLAAGYGVLLGGGTRRTGRRGFVALRPEQRAWLHGLRLVEPGDFLRLEALVRSEQFAVAVGLVARVQRAVETEMARTTRRVLHRLNLPAGTDVTRILNELGQLRLQVRDLTAELAEARAQLARQGGADKADVHPRRRSASGPKASAG